MGLAVGIGLAVACTAPEVLPPPATPTSAAEYLEKPQPVLVQGALVPQPANAPVTEEPTPPAVPQSSEPPEASPPVSPPSLCATVDTARLNVRSSPSVTDTNQVGFIERGDVFTIIGNNSDGSWLQLDIPVISGDTWVSVQFVVEGPCS